ncbi:helicase [Agromyces sp. SYSU T00194]|uniref:helicase n=1 Tax=Agromyces chitinivorans TaxID=3158560 RepID=UPI0033945FC4
MRSERGAGSVLALAVVGATSALASAVLAACAVLPAGRMAANAADAAALAAADAAAGAVGGQPCARAAEAAARNGAVLEACALDGLIAETGTSVTIAGLPVGARSRAGPPGGASVP